MEKKEENNVTVTISSTWSNLKLLKEWDDDCKQSFGDCRWMKMWNDHLASKREKVLDKLIEEISMLKARMDILESKPKPKKRKEVVKTLGKGGDENE